MTFADSIRTRIGRSQTLTLDLLARLDPAHLSHRAGQSSTSIAWHAWHIGRWTDRVASHSSNPPSVELWEEKGLAQAWGWEGFDLGSGSSGMEMEEDRAASLEMPGRDQLVAYLEAAFLRLTEFSATLGDHDLTIVTTDLYGRQVSVADVLLNHLAHIDRHLGMIEAVAGIVEGSGSATV